MKVPSHEVKTRNSLPNRDWFRNIPNRFIVTQQDMINFETRVDQIRENWQLRLEDLVEGEVYEIGFIHLPTSRDLIHHFKIYEPEPTVYVYVGKQQLEMDYGDTFSHVLLKESEEGEIFHVFINTKSFRNLFVRHDAEQLIRKFC